MHVYPKDLGHADLRLTIHELKSPQKAPEIPCISGACGSRAGDSEETGSGAGADNGAGNELGPGLLDTPAGQQTSQPVMLLFLCFHREFLHPGAARCEAQLHRINHAVAERLGKHAGGICTVGGRIVHRSFAVRTTGASGCGAVALQATQTGRFLLAPRIHPLLQGIAVEPAVLQHPAE